MDFDYKIIIYIIFGVIPSLTWLFYYLSKDLHPEPKKMILKIFLWGAAMTIPVFFVQIGLRSLLDQTNINPVAYNLIYWFLVISLSEEFFKYLVVRLKVLNSPHLDEPLDLMLYMTVSALGFAAVENILYLFAPTGGLSLNALLTHTLAVAFIRFIGATFLHTLCSATIGYFVAVSLFDQKNRLFEVFCGITAAVLLHGLYDFSIMIPAGQLNLNLILPAIILVILGFLVFSGFANLQKLKGITKLNIK